MRVRNRTLDQRERNLPINHHGEMSQLAKRLLTDRDRSLPQIPKQSTHIQDLIKLWNSPCLMTIVLAWLLSLHERNPDPQVPVKACTSTNKHNLTHSIMTHKSRSQSQTDRDMLKQTVITQRKLLIYGNQSNKDSFLGGKKGRSIL